MLVYMLYDLNNDKVERISKEEREKLLDIKKNTYEFYNKLIYYHIESEDGKYHLLIDDKVNNILVKLVTDKVLVIDDSKMTVEPLPYFLIQDIKSKLTEKKNNEHPILKADKCLGLFLMFTSEHTIEEVLKHTHRIESGAIKQNVWGKEYTIPVDIRYKVIGGREVKMAISITWEAFTDFYYDVLRTFFAYNNKDI